ncbi:MAG: helix-turn-helix domain-containing protein, partial [Acidimicrobiales bacterium]
LVVVAAETRGLADDSLPGVERQLADLGIVSGWRLTPSLHLGIVSLHPHQYETVLKILDEKASARTGLSPAYRSLSDTPRALRLARAALSLVPAGSAEVRTFDPSPLAALVVHEPGEGKRLANEVLGSVTGLAAKDRANIVETLVAYLDHGGSAEQAGLALGCHANTIRYRLRRLQALTGRSLSDPHGIAELTGAVLALRLATSAGPGQESQPSPAAGRPRPVTNTARPRSTKSTILERET